MKLHAFIEQNLEQILQESQVLARTVLPAVKSLPDSTFRALSRELLEIIVHGLQKSAERMQVAAQDAAKVASTADHGARRQQAGFDLGQVFGEFQIMRSRILALWRDSGDPGSSQEVLDQVDSFNKVVDDALYDVVQNYVRNVSASRDMFLAVLAHDLRSPLHGIAMANSVLSRELPETVRIETATRAMRATKMMDSLITDCLEFTRSRLGGAIPIERLVCDLGQACEEALELVKVSEPHRQFLQQISGNMHHYADYARVRQVLANLLNNAVQHGELGTPIVLTARGEKAAITISVTNTGKPIPLEAAKVIFEPLVQVPLTTSDVSQRPKTSLGLGLFIAREIIRSHEGTVSVQSSAEGKTVFTIRLPRPEPTSS